MDLSLDALSGYLWLAAVAVAVVVFGVVFAYVLARRHQRVLGRAFRRVDAWLEKRIPRAWHFTRRRFARDVWYGLALTAALLIAAGCAFLFAEVTEGWTSQDRLYEIDQAVHERLDGMVTPGVAAFFGFITHLGDFLFVGSVAAVVGVLFALRRRWWQLLALGLTIGVGEGILWGLKYLFARERPGRQLADAVGAAFPSGHAFAATVLYGFLTYLVWQSRLGRGARIAATVVLGVVTLLVGLSRIVLNVHWVSDVLGGFTIGLGWLVTSLILARAAESYHHRRRQGQRG